MRQKRLYLLCLSSLDFEAPGTVVFVGVCIGWTGNYFCFDSWVNCLSKACIFNNPYWFAGEVGEPFSFSGFLDPAAIHPEDDGVFIFLYYFLFVN